MSRRRALLAGRAAAVLLVPVGAGVLLTAGGGAVTFS